MAARPVAVSTGRPPCRYGTKCYRKNPEHLEQYSHPDRGPKLESDNDDVLPSAKRVKIDDGSDDVVIVDSGSTSPSSSSPVRSKPNPLSGKAGEVSRDRPPHFYLTKVRGIDSRYNLSDQAIGIKDILAMGDLISSIQFNYMFDIPWLVLQYPKDKRNSPILLVHGDQRHTTTQLRREAESYPNVKLFPARLNSPFGTHHTKMMLLRYPEGIRVVIHTANLIQKDWDQKTQGVWLSPVFPRQGDSASSEPHDDFKSDLIEYLEAYGGCVLNKWIKAIKEHDMKEARVRLVGSVPGAHTGRDMSQWGHFKLRKILSVVGPSGDEVDESWPVIGQFSSVGSLGPSSHSWLTSEWLLSLSSGRRTKAASSLHKYPNLKLVFPTATNVRDSLEAGGSLPYASKTASKQPYLTTFLHEWKAESTGRSRACPHIKTYCRLSKDSTKAAWFLLTSANLSKAAWGGLEKKGTQLRIRSYEMGVLFLPSHQDQHFDVIRGPEKPSNSSALQIPFDVPLIPYGREDNPWIWDASYMQPDCHGLKWTPNS